MEAYVLEITVLRSKQLNLKVCPADGIDRDTAVPFSEVEFAPGKYLVEGPARKCHTATARLGTARSGTESSLAEY